jgi:hypothetical protein
VQHAGAPVLLVPAGVPAGGAFAPGPASLPAPAAGGPTTVTLSPEELSLVLHGLEAALQAAAGDPVVGAPIRALRDRLEATTHRTAGSTVGTSA